jgi:hypothetical protein
MRGGSHKTFQRMYCNRHNKVKAFISEKDGFIYFCKRDYFHILFGNYDGDLGCGLTYFSLLNRSTIDN